jgi:DNA invertase Pin-like site-specific DNA recombinase
MTVFAGIAEFERDLIRERTSAGREAAKGRGTQFGRPRKLNPEQTKLARRLIDEDTPSGRLPTPSTSTPQPSIGSQRRRLNKLGCGYLVQTLC